MRGALSAEYLARVYLSDARLEFSPPREFQLPNSVPEKQTSIVVNARFQQDRLTLTQTCSSRSITKRATTSRARVGRCAHVRKAALELDLKQQPQYLLPRRYELYAHKYERSGRKSTRTSLISKFDRLTALRRVARI